MDTSTHTLACAPMRPTLKILCNHVLVRHRFFQNIGTISIFAVFGTFISTFYIAFFLEVNAITPSSVPVQSNYALSDNNWEHTNLTMRIQTTVSAHIPAIAPQPTHTLTPNRSQHPHTPTDGFVLGATAGGPVARLFARARRCHHRRVLALRSPDLRRRPR